ncbi:MAG TPA: adenylosuccinate synthase [Bacteroidales bacterium]|nr:adenylosuccinate synthase [Bacteroidales bacterium]HSA44775.1 adenylosuccinate synthase [Bacteroidales bacterium]
MKADVILGLQWGDEGKGKIVDLLAPSYDIIARFQGGPNAGHTIEIGGRKHILHLIPSGIFHPGIQNLIGNGVIIDPVIFRQETEGLKETGIHPAETLLISDRAHLILPTHRLLDACYEQSKAEKKIGSTLKGIGPAYTDKTARIGLRTGDLTDRDFRTRYELLKKHHLQLAAAAGISSNDILIDGLSLDAYEKAWFESLEVLLAFKMVDNALFLNRSLERGMKVLAEGAQGTLLDVDFGSYPYVTSSSTTAGGVSTGLGIPPSRIGEVYGVFKAYCTRVGNGPFPTELNDETGQLLRDLGHEYGSTTGRPRRCGWLDLPALRYAIMINGVSRLIMMKADVLNHLPEIGVCTQYRIDDRLSDFPEARESASVFEAACIALPGWQSEPDPALPFDSQPDAFKSYVSFIEKAVDRKISVLSLGAERNQTLMRDRE